MMTLQKSEWVFFAEKCLFVLSLFSWEYKATFLIVSPPPTNRYDSNASASDSSEDGDDSEDESAKKKKVKKAKVVKEKKERKPRKEVS